MLVHLRSQNFNPKFLEYVFQDPVHAFTDERNLERRCRYDRNIFFWVEDNIPKAVLCVAYTNKLHDDVDEILSSTSPVTLNATHAVFYSVFKTDSDTETKNVGALLIREASQWIKTNLSQIVNYVTMSPIPNLSAHFTQPPSIDDVVEFLRAQKDPVARFHIRNGARVLRVIPNADNSERRRIQSYSNMVNYDYTPNIMGNNEAINN